MAKYIDANALAKRAYEVAYQIVYDTNSHERGLSLIGLAQLLDEAPSAQPDIIRCKDCMHNGSFDTDCPIDWNGKEYCSFAER